MKLLTQRVRKDDTKREKTARREKKERMRIESMKSEPGKKKNMNVEVMVDSGFPRSKYRVVDESGKSFILSST